MKNHWLKQREIDNDWHHFTIYFDASKTEVYVDGELVEEQVYNHEGNLSFVQYVHHTLTEEAIKEMMAEEDAKFMEIVSAAIDEATELEVQVPPMPDYEITFDRPLEHNIDMMGL